MSFYLYDLIKTKNVIDEVTKADVNGQYLVR